LWRHKDKDKHHFIIQICPALEKWILEVCKKGSIDISKFGLTEFLDSLKNYTKTQSNLQDEKLKKLFKEIANKKDIKEVNKLRSWITILKGKNYRVDINDLKNA
jgi:polyhydroxyalkanoate synthesis regulator phasin